MDFGKILETWERHQPVSEPPRFDRGDDGQGKLPAQYRKGTVKGFEAQERLREFLNDAVVERLTRLLVILGKVLHSRQESVIPQLVRDELGHSPWVQEYGDAERRLGGTGATWIKLKQKSSENI